MRHVARSGGVWAFPSAPETSCFVQSIQSRMDRDPRLVSEGVAGSCQGNGISRLSNPSISHMWEVLGEHNGSPATSRPIAGIC